METEEFIQLHNAVINRNAKDGWHWRWNLNRILDKSLSNRYGWFINTITNQLSNCLNGMKVLDVAGGIGHFGTYLMKKENYKFDYTVIDLTIMKPIAEDYFKTFGVNGKFIIGDITYPHIFQELQIKPETFDMVWLFSWCQILGVNCEILFSEIYSILKLNGIFMFNMAYEGYNTSYNNEALKIMLTKIGFKTEIIEKDKSGFAQEYFVLVRK